MQLRVAKVLRVSSVRSENVPVGCPSSGPGMRGQAEDAPSQVRRTLERSYLLGGTFIVSLLGKTGFGEVTTVVWARVDVFCSSLMVEVTRSFVGDLLKVVLGLSDNSDIAWVIYILQNQRKKQQHSMSLCFGIHAHFIKNSYLRSKGSSFCNSGFQTGTVK
ncbi:hypothetical protein CDAR_22561 [Caerostris darwini]|uniref:Uncharacterized protein n=1 Tax=Caerostris darwini TaxID=1538125 RepID=A0AAV4VA60_9ARAC|nr:hypothetical protein CDAR_22561 [Caerostris darwini]